MAETSNPGRARVAENKRKKKRTISLSDEEFAKLLSRAGLLNQNVSEYIISQLKLNK